LAVNSSNNLYIADSVNSVVREVGANGFIDTVTGTGVYGDTGNSNASFSGDGGLATAAVIDTPEALATDSAGNVYIADTRNGRVRRVSPPLASLVP